MSTATLLPPQRISMTPAQLAAVSYLARYSGRIHGLYSYQLRRWFTWCETNGLDPLVDVQPAHIGLYIRQLGKAGLMAASVTTMMHAVRGYFRPHRRRHQLRPRRLCPAAGGPHLRVPHPRPAPAEADPVPPGRPDHQRPPRRPGLRARHQRVRASEAAAVRIEHYADTLRGHRVLHPVGKRDQPATMPPTVPRIAKAASIPRHISPHLLRHAAINNALDAGVLLREAQILARHADTHHRALRPSPRQPRPTRRPLPHRLRRRRLARP
jgi:integrase/recombinase XerD